MRNYHYLCTRYTNRTSSKMKRDLYWDNLKFILIFLVVFGHTIEQFAVNGSLLRAIYNWLLMFNMPLFIFVSGRFTHVHDKEKFKRGILRILETYIVFQAIKCIDPLMNLHITGKLIYSLIVIPRWALWYLLSLVCWRLILYFIPRNLRENKPLLILLICFAISLLGGFLPINKQLSLQRTMAFLPFFFLGYYSTRIDIKHYISKIPKAIPVTVLLAVFLFMYYCMNYDFTIIQGGSSSYWIKPGISPIFYCLSRAAFLLSAMIISFMVLCLIKTSALFAQWGTKTLAIYVYHTFLILFMLYLIRQGILPQNSILLFFYAAAITIVLVYLSRFKLFNILLNPVSYFLEK